MDLVFQDGSQYSCNTYLVFTEEVQAALWVLKIQKYDCDIVTDSVLSNYVKF